MQRRFLTGLVLMVVSMPPCAGTASTDLMDVDYTALVSRADLRYDRPVERSEEGLPIGNGRMGSLVWTVPTSLRLQINRVDVFACNRATNSFPERYSDYCGGCGFVDVDFVDFGPDVFANDHTRQHLSCYDGLVNVEGQGVNVQVLAWNERDVIALEVSDERKEPYAISTHLRMLRPALSKRRSHTAASKLDSRDGRIILTQQFTEDDYYCGSAVAVGVFGRDARIKQVNDQELQLVAEPGNGRFTILIASAASFERKQDVAASALAQLDAAAAKGYVGLLESNKRWWRDFWAKSFVYLHSADGVADMIQENYTYYLYVMASSSRGKFPPKFNGMLWTTGGDTRKWGAQYWGANQSCLYNALFATNQIELMDPMFDMYSGMYDSCALAARQQWGSQGIYIPETVAFDGLARLPDAIAKEMQDLYLLRKPWEARSAQFIEYARTKQPLSSRWNWKAAGKWVEGRWRYTDKGAGPYGNVNHIFSRSAKIAYKYWLRYEYTMDTAWLRDRAYPMLKGVAEFYRNYPNVSKGPDGRYHIHNVNSNESVWGGQDTDEEISAMRGILPIVIRASEILNVDASMRPIWREFLNHLAPLPLSKNSPHIWVSAREPVSRGRAESRPDGNTMPMWYFDLCTLENKDAETLKIANATFDSFFRSGVGPDTRIGVLSKLAVAAAILGRRDDVKFLIPNQIQTKETPILANRMTLREGAQTTGLQRIGRAADALLMALCQSVPAGPAKDPVIRVFPAWPKEWDAAFTLLARGAFLVSSSMQAGQIEFVEIHSNAGQECHLQNPWPDKTVTLRRDGRKAEDLSGSLLTFSTTKNETIVVVPRGSTVHRMKIL
jgi:Glycosyl hydrolase family 95 catalytic domain/Glycoside hydrolase family 95, C-terminal domain